MPGCDKSAQSSTKFCVKHGGGKKCQHPGCEKVSRGRTLYCAAVRYSLCFNFIYILIVEFSEQIISLFHSFSMEEAFVVS